MESRLSIRGNALAPVLVLFPLGSLTVAVILDVFRLLGAPSLIGTLAYCTVAAGLVGGAVTALALRIDDLAAADPADGQAAARRFLFDGTVLIVFAVVLLLRLRTPDRTAGPGLLVVEFAGLALAACRAAAAVPLTNDRQEQPETGTVRLAQILDGPREPREAHRPDPTG